MLCNGRKAFSCLFVPSTQRKGMVITMKTGLIHIYCGNGKGKTTCAMGLCTRAAGFGHKVLIYQFMKNNKTSERKVLEALPNVTFVNGLDSEKFSFQMSEVEKEARKKYYLEQFKKVTGKAAKEEYQILFLDELLYTIGAGLFEEEILVEYLKTKPESLEVILTGQNPGEKVVELADYVSEIVKVKHPFDRGIGSRDGIER